MMNGHEEQDEQDEQEIDEQAVDAHDFGSSFLLISSDPYHRFQNRITQTILVLPGKVWKESPLPSPKGEATAWKTLG